MFSFNSLRASTCTFLVLLVVGMISALALPNATTMTSEATTKPLIGGVVNIDVNSKVVQNYASLGLEEYAKDKSYEPMIVKINSATQELVSGDLYKINVTFGETNCAKEQKTNCTLKQNGETQNCKVEVWSQPWLDNGHPKVTVTCA